jgi:uncharacterized membrane protein
MSSKSKKNLPARQRTPNVAATHVAASYSGPIPPASEMMKYEEACPGLPSRIMEMAEKQSAHRQHIEAIAIKASSRNSTLGVIFAFLLAIATLCIGGLCIFLDKDGLGTLIGGAGLASIVGAFIYGTRSNRAERESKSKEY